MQDPLFDKKKKKKKEKGVKNGVEQLPGKNNSSSEPLTLKLVQPL